MAKAYLKGYWINGRRCYHIETELGIINIRPGLRNTNGQEVCSIEILPDEGVEMDPQAYNIRLIARAGRA